jgi:uncharacterized protein
MIALGLIGAVLFVLLIFGPQAWIRIVMARHAGERHDFPGTGGELARHLLDEAGLKSVKVEHGNLADHYSPADKAVRLSDANFNGRSVTAAAVAAHEVGHALQDAQGYGPLHLRQRLAGLCTTIERTGSVVLMATPVIFMLTRSPLVLVGEIVAAIGIMLSTVVVHAVTLPAEFDASFRRALPTLEGYLKPADMPGARSVLQAAAFTYVAGALVNLIDFARWLRILRI